MSNFITDVPAIIQEPKSSWIVVDQPSCSCCGKYCDFVVQVQPDDEYAGACICVDCARRVLAMLEGV